MKLKFLVYPFLIGILSNIVYGNECNDLETQKAALKVVADFADRICNEIPLVGESGKLELTGKAKVELNKLVKKIVDAGIDGAIKYQSSEYSNVLQTDLAKTIYDNSQCKKDVWDDLKSKLITCPRPPPITETFSRDFSFEDHRCSVDEPKSSSVCVDAGYKFEGMVGQPVYSSKDSCGSHFLSIERDSNNVQCGVFKVQLVGCGHDSLKICKGHAWIKGTVEISGTK